MKRQYKFLRNTLIFAIIGAILALFLPYLLDSVFINDLSNPSPRIDERELLNDLAEEKYKVELELRIAQQKLKRLEEEIDRFKNKNNEYFQRVQKLKDENEKILKQLEELRSIDKMISSQTSNVTKRMESDPKIKVEFNAPESNKYEALAQRIAEEIDQEAISMKLEIEMKIERLKSKPFVFTIEENLFLEKKYECNARIGNIQSLDTLVRKTKRELSSSAIMVEDSIRVDFEMSVNLVGKNFLIERITSEKQLIVDTDEYTEWKWYVTPSEADSQMLEILVYAHIYIDGSEKSHKVNVYKKSVDVKVGFVNGTKLFLRKNWEWIATAFVPLILFGYNKRSDISTFGIRAKMGTIQGFSSGLSWVAKNFQNIVAFAKKKIGK